MAYNKNNGETVITTENVEKEEITKTIETKKTKNDELAELRNTVDALKAQNEMLMKMFMNAQNLQNTVVPQQNNLNQEVTLVHLIERMPGLTTHIELSNLTIDMVAFGEERLLDRRQCEEIAGKYRKFFEKGIIAFGEDGDELASRFGLKSTKDYSYLNKDFVKKLGTLSLVELENLYNKVSTGHKKFIIEYFKRKINEKDPNFKDIHKVEMLNRISKGAMSGTTLDFEREAQEAAKNK